MGMMSYDTLSVQFDDRVLAHLHVVILRKFRARESFVMSWADGVVTGSGRTVIWLTPSLPIVFKFAGSRSPEIDQAWLDILSASADGPRGLVVADPQGNLIKSTGSNKHP